MSLPTLDNLAPKEAGGAATKFPGIVADLDTRPNAIGGLSAAELKAKFDEAARVIQNYINNVLLPAMLSSGATSIGYQASAADLPDYRPDTVSDALAGLESLVASLLPIKVNGKVCFCNNLTIPVSGSISAAYNSIYPRPLVGDYVVNQNGEMGHITAVVIGDVVTVTAANYTLKAVLTDETQNLSATQKTRARSNIGALGSADTEAKYVKYDDYASYTDAQKATARANIGALEKANPHVETRMTVDGVLDAEGGIEAYDDVTVEGALTVKDASKENGISLSQTDAAVLSFAGATPQTKPVLRNIAGPVMNNDAATKAYVDAADAAQAQQAAETYLPKLNPEATGELTIEGELTVADTLGNEVHVQAGSGNAMVLQGGSNHAGTVEIKGVGTPTADSSAAPKGYVDTQIAGVNKILLYDGTISATAGDTAALSATSFSPQNAILGDVVVGTNGYTAAVVTKLTPTMFVVRSTGQQFAPGGGSLSSEAKAALLNCFAHVAWIDEHGQDYYDELEAALMARTLESITAVFVQGDNVIYDTDSLDDLKPMLTVTAYYDDGTSATVTSYTLSGTLEAGTSTITVEYESKTTTINVVVTHEDVVADGIYTPQEIVRGQYIDETGAVQSATNESCYIADFIPIGSNKYGILYTNAPSNVPSLNWRVSEYDENKIFIKQTQYKYSTQAYSATIMPTDSRTKFVRLGWYYAGQTTFVAVFSFKKILTANLEMEVGNIDSNGANDDTMDLRIRSVGYIPAESFLTSFGCPFASTWQAWGANYAGFAFRCYDASNNFIASVLDGGDLFKDNIGRPITLPTGTSFVRVIMQKNRESSFSPGFSADAINPITINFVEYRITEAS